MAVLSVTSLRLFKFINMSQFLPEIVTVTSLSKIRTFENILLGQSVRVFSKKAELESQNPFGMPETARKRTVPIQKIMLLSPEGKVIEQLTLEQAQNLAKRRNFNLVQVVDVGLKTLLPTYQLMSKTQLIEEKMKAKSQKAFEKSTSMKEVKLIIISSKIDKHDLETKINKIIKLLNKHHKVQVYVSTDGNKIAMETVSQSIESGIVQIGKLQNKVPKAGGVKLYFEPIILPKETKEENLSP